MGEILGSALWFIVAISVLVAVHEYGHYIVGRWCGMKVLRFSIGFGKPIWSWYGKDPDRTQYCVSAIPLGGYVKFLDEREQRVDAADRGRAFTHRPTWQRIAVLLAGPMFNFLLAIVIYWALFASGVTAYRAAVGEVEQDSFASAAGLQYRDRIVAVGDRAAADWDSVLLAMIGEMVSDGEIPLRVENDDGRQRDVIIQVGDASARLTEPGYLFDGLGFQLLRSPILAEVNENSAAAAGGLKIGDRITSIDGQPVYDLDDPKRILTTLAEQTISIGYVRDGREFQTVTTVKSSESNGEQYGVLGVTLGLDIEELRYKRKYGFFSAGNEAIQKTWSTITSTGRLLAGMVMGDVSARNISGPISIARFARASAERGFESFVKLLATISIGLGILNLLPIPILDGGQILYQSIERLKGSPLSDRAQIIGQQIGIFALLMLMSFAFYNDFTGPFS